MADDFWGSLGSIVGIGVGSMEIMLVSPRVKPGGTVHGRLMLKLARKTEAKKLVIGIEAIETRERETVDARGYRTRSNEARVLHRFEQQLDGTRAYQNEAYDLHLPVPAQATVELPQGVLGDVARFVSAVQSLRRDPPKWSVYATLEIPWKANVRARVDLSILTS